MHKKEKKKADSCCVVIGSALSHITRELAAVGIAPAPPIPEAAPQTPAASAEVPVVQGVFTSSPMMPLQQPQPQLPRDHVFQAPWTTTFQPESISMHPGVYEAMSSIQPLSVGVGALHELDSQKTQSTRG